MRNAGAKVCRAAGPRWEAPRGAGGRGSVRCGWRGLLVSLEKPARKQGQWCDEKIHISKRTQMMRACYEVVMTAKPRLFTTFLET